MFTFLRPEQHCRLSRCSHLFSNLAALPSSSPQVVLLSAGIDHHVPVPLPRYITRMRPHKLISRLDQWMFTRILDGVAIMSSIEELHLPDSDGLDFSQFHSLRPLTKLRTLVCYPSIVLERSRIIRERLHNWQSIVGLSIVPISTLRFGVGILTARALVELPPSLTCLDATFNFLDNRLAVPPPTQLTNLRHLHVRGGWSSQVRDLFVIGAPNLTELSFAQVDRFPLGWSQFPKLATLRLMDQTHHVADDLWLLANECSRDGGKRYTSNLSSLELHGGISKDFASDWPLAELAIYCPRLETIDFSGSHGDGYFRITTQVVFDLRELIRGAFGGRIKQFIPPTIRELITIED